MNYEPLNHEHMVHDIWLDVLRGRSVAGALNLLSDIQTLHNTPKKIIRFWQLRIVSSADKELATIRICTGIRHRHTARFICSQHRLIFEFIPRASTAAGGGITCLNDVNTRASLKHTVKDHTIIEMMLRQVNEVIDSFWRQPWIEFQHNQAAIGIHPDTIEFVDIDAHGRRFRVGVLSFIERCLTWGR